ncbi:glycosyltransferase family 4 protein [Flavobacterium restrictum]|uniref:Glycosyltransferase n=1 Tax=Flavobacterium restrictum TaxID=2594428 RepID=A0A553E870_9FLAO|nr:glycosyltransferase [Flavobacterium restrictum]TRX41264.1 glycosyltransferase [Flavobacterium restrictum]
MKLVVISSAPFIYKKGIVYAYSPYVNELLIWQKHTDSIVFCCPTWRNDNGLLITEVPFKIKKQFVLLDFNLKTLASSCAAFFNSFYNLFVLYKVMQQADHIHLRCPGNIGLLASMVQLLFPATPKTAKYAGNWDPKSQQPWTYRLQKWLISNPFLTRNIQVLVYGEWEGSSKNIKPFFTATYTEADKTPVLPRNWSTTIQFVFAGTLVKGKNPLYAIQLVEALHQKGHDVQLTLYGEGVLRTILEEYVAAQQLQDVVRLAGNQTKETVQKAYQESHFVLLPSDSEGWPKVIAEGMFWGCIPLSTAVSCVPYMLDYGQRGVLLDKKLFHDSQQLIALLQSPTRLALVQESATSWSRRYTMDVFETEIKKILQP